MLVLSRNLNERIVIAETIVIEILELKGGRVRIGIEAPDDISVWREEVVLTRNRQECLCHPVRHSRSPADSPVARTVA